MGIDISLVYRGRPPKCYGQMALDSSPGQTQGVSRASAAAALSIAVAVTAGCTGGSAAPAATTPAPPVTTPVPVASTPPGSAPAADALVARLRAGGLILYFRHAITDQSRQDDPRPDLNDRTTQRNLSDRGRAQATEIGTAIRALGIPVGDVLASPYARTVETGELAFGSGRVRASRDLLNEAYPGTDDADLARRLRRLLAQRPPIGRNTVLIGHGFNITEAAGITIAEGECAVFEPAGESGFRLVGRFTAQRWRELARPR
jgi:phosphohistidine phosphatase SixA